MENISKDPLWEIADKLSNEELMTLCLTNKRYYNKVCNNKQFWYWRIYKRFGDIEIPDSLRQDCLNNPKCIWDILTMNTLYMFGHNRYGQLGTENTRDILVPINVMNNIKDVSCGVYHTGVITTDNKLFMFGLNGFGQLGTVDERDRLTPTNVRNDIKYVSCGGRSTGVITTDNKLFMFGFNNKGQLGTGDTSKRSTPTNVLNDIKYIS
uniref:Regulator of chromosome condensation protein n=1 Tax=Pithovirus LCPAC302 TaxID=2506593 RepID=A0A481Z739_9VIRU|nr:MAG: regulator of chromosome condensation protein [Pithovirus LCPAC302]